jgi:glyoxylate/hydroxypyruvate reductase A
MTQEPPARDPVVLIGSEVTDEWRAALAGALGERVLSDDEGSARVAVAVGKVDRELLVGLGELELLVTLWAGVDALLDDELVPGHIQVVRANDPSLRESMVQSVVLHVLSAHRNVIDYRNLQRDRTWRQLPQPRAQERRVGLLGLGQIGAAAASALAGIGFPVTGWSRTPRELPGVRCLAGDDALGSVLAESEILVCVLPLTPATRGLIGADALALLPRGATVINLGRGDQIDEAALLDALDRGHLDGAILDVFSAEPLPASHPFWTHDRVIVYPHVGGDPDPVTGAAAAAEIVRRRRAGEPLDGIVDRDQGY